MRHGISHAGWYTAVDDGPGQALHELPGPTEGVPYCSTATPTTTMDGWRGSSPAGVTSDRLGIKMKIIGGRVRLAASDVANFLACRRLTQLDLLRARRELRPPRECDVGFAELVRRGEVHERGVLERFRADGLDVVDVSADKDFRDGAAATAEAIRGG